MRSAHVEVLVRHGVEHRIAVRQTNVKQKLGLKFLSPQCTALVVAAVEPGWFQSWNECHPGREVNVKDRIVAVGSTRGDALELLKKLQKSREYQVTIVRPASSMEP